MAPQPRSAQLQIRVTPREKARLKRLARAAGMDLSAYVLSRALPPESERLAGLLEALRRQGDRRFALAEFDEVLSALSAADFPLAVESLDVTRLDSLTQNQVAAMVEQAAAQRQAPPPAWTRDVVALERPWFATDLKALRLHLLRASPVVFRRRNLFVDAGIGSRV